MQMISSVEPKKYIYFRADGNEIMGLGHIYRILALFEMFNTHYQCIFLTKESSSLNIVPENFSVKMIPNNINLLDEPSWLMNQCAKNAILIVDGYQFSTEYQKGIKEKGFKLVYIDDLMQNYMFADIIINHSPGITPKDYNSETYTNFALGSEFAILRPLFIEAAKRNPESSKIDTAFVCFGGSDQFNLTYKTTIALLEIDQFIKINIVLGSAYEDSKIFELEAKTSRIKIYKNLSEKDLVSVMQESNFAIIPASNILFEIMAMKIPFITGYYVENQKQFYSYLTRNKLVFGLDDFVKKTDKEIKKYILKFLIEKDDFSFKTNSLIDGKSPERILMKIKKLYHD